MSAKENNSKRNWLIYSEQIGDICELQIASRLRCHGRVSLPYGNSPYDVVYETPRHKMIRMQVKHAKIKCSDTTDNVSLTFRTVDTNGNKYHKEDIDCFAVYSSELNQAWIVPFDVAGNQTRCTLNLVKTNRSQGLDCSAYELEEKIKEINNL